MAAAHNRSAVFARWRTMLLARPTYHLERQLDRFSRFCMAYATFSLYVTLRRTILPPH